MTHNTESLKAARILGVVWNDKMTLNMFLDFVKKVYLPGTKIEILSYTLMNSSDVPGEPDIVSQTLNQVHNIPDTRFIFVAVKSPKTLNPENKVLINTLKQIPHVVYLPPDSLHSIQILSDSPILEELTERWCTNILRISGVKT